MSVSKRSAKSIYIYIYKYIFRARAANPDLAWNPPALNHINGRLGTNLPGLLCGGGGGLPSGHALSFLVAAPLRAGTTESACFIGRSVCSQWVCGVSLEGGCLVLLTRVFEHDL